MAWHILHSLLDQVRIHSTFPGKLWIVMMFIFRIVVVARIGDHVYEDEQHQFICNTLTPGCKNVCYNIFRPISEIRFWSLMVLFVSTPGILFFVYAGHKIYHAHAKFPLDEEDNENGQSPPPSYNQLKRKRTESSPFVNATAPQLYVVKRLHSKRDNRSDRASEKNGKEKNSTPSKYPKLSADEEKEFLEKRQFSDPPSNNSRRWWGWSEQSRSGFPVYDRHGRQIDFIQPTNPVDEARARKEMKDALRNPQLYRAYWWHVFMRTLLEAGFLVGQYFLYGFYVPELYECTRWPCVKTVDCYVSRPLEKTCLMYLMFSLGAVSCLLSFAEFYTLGWERFQYAVCCRGPKVTYEEKRRRLAQLAHHNHGHNLAKTYHKPAKDEMMSLHHANFTSRLSLDSLSSETTVESV